jgi:DNA gyrase subunit A
MGRTAVGVRGIRLKDGDYCVAAIRGDENEDILTVTENGYGKRTPVTEYSLQGRGGMGLKNYNVTEKTGPIAGAVRVSGSEDILLISDDGTIIRMAAADVNIYNRSAQGVRVMRVSPDSKVIALARVDKEMDDGAAES